MQEAQAAATQQVEAIALAVSMVLGGKSKEGAGAGDQQVTYEDAAGLEAGLQNLFRMG